jgi:phosphatidylinositol alpha-1,6-mannosyltransferase
MGSDSKPRALIISRNLPPLTGGMERLNLHAYQALRQQFQTAVCGPSGVGEFLEAGDTQAEVEVASLSRFLIACQWKSLRLALGWRPQVVYSGSGLTAPAALVAARAVGAQAVCFLHGLDIIADHPVYRHLFLPAIQRHDRILVNSRSTAALAKDAGVSTDRIKVVHPGVDLPDLSTRDEARLDFRERYGLGNRPILLAAGRLTERKGLAPFIRSSLPEIIRHEPDTLLVVVGGEASQALQHRKGVVADIRSAAAEVGLESQVRLLGSVPDAELSQAYFAADLLVFPVLELPGDVEGFGMVAVEAAAHGLRTVAFRVGGVADAIADDVSGWLLEPGDYSAMSRMVIHALQTAEGKESSGHMEKVRQHAEGFRWDAFDRTFLDSLPDTRQND